MPHELARIPRYSPTEAAHIVAMKPDTLRRWVGLRSGADAVVGVELSGDHRLSFLDLAELACAIRLKEQSGLSTVKLRDLLHGLRSIPQFAEHEHPLLAGRSQFLVHGRNVSLDLQHQILDLVDEGQTVLELVRSVAHPVEFDADGFATALYPRQPDGGVVVRPTHAWGAPTVAGTRVQTSTLAGFVRAGDSPEFIARAFGLSLEQVMDALRFENVEAPKAA